MAQVFLALVTVVAIMMVCDGCRSFLEKHRGTRRGNDASSPRGPASA